jgi:hypothetical protein
MERSLPLKPTLFYRAHFNYIPPFITGSTGMKPHCSIERPTASIPPLHYRAHCHQSPLSTTGPATKLAHPLLQGPLPLLPTLHYCSISIIGPDNRYSPPSTIGPIATKSHFPQQCPLPIEPTLHYRAHFHHSSPPPPAASPAHFLLINHSRILQHNFLYIIGGANFSSAQTIFFFCTRLPIFRTSTQNFPSSQHLTFSLSPSPLFC